MSRQGVGFGGRRIWPIAFLTAIGSLGAIPQAQAAIYYWQDSDPGIARPAPSATPRKAKAHHRSESKAAAAAKEAAKPHGPLIISISIAEQRLRLYDAHGLFAESQISTGVQGHPTPMGVFSIIQKQRFHQSNIYSGAPMPFMQRITWSGIALHAGVVPGHPASHGCIRMPEAFAIKMWNWTKMGARVVVTPGPISPSNFSHPLLAALKVMPQSAAMNEPKSDVAAAPESEKAPKVAASAATPLPEPRVELRSTIGHDDNAKAPVDQAETVSSTKTADASGVLPAAASKTDASPGEGTPPGAGAAAISDKPDASSPADVAEVAKSDARPDAAVKDQSASSADKPASNAPAPGEPVRVSDNDAKPVEAVGIQPSKADETIVTEAVEVKEIKPQDTSATVTSAPPAEAVTPKIAAETPAEKPAETVPPTAAAPLPAANPPSQDAVPNPAPQVDPALTIKRTGQIAVFVSRKDSKLYVRQNFSPLFDLPVTIAPDPRPLGTHVFTAQVDNSDANVLHWSVVSLPVPARHADHRKEVPRAAHGRKAAPAAPVETKAQPLPDGPTEALDRLNLPAGVMAKIFDAISTGGSIIVSDQGIAAGETGEGTDFIVSLR